MYKFPASSYPMMKPMRIDRKGPLKNTQGSFLKYESEIPHANYAQTICVTKHVFHKIFEKHRST